MMLLETGMKEEVGISANWTVNFFFRVKGLEKRQSPVSVTVEEGDSICVSKPAWHKNTRAFCPLV